MRDRVAEDGIHREEGANDADGAPVGNDGQGGVSEDADRRRFLGDISRAAMTVGLIGGYGGLGLVAGRYLYPARPADRVWQFVATIGSMSVGDARPFRAPSGESINIVRQGNSGDAGDFVALSGTCPHLGCQVHWEPQNDRYFCPCHNGTFNPSGTATGGPPADAGQDLPRYPLRVEGDLLFIEVPAERLVGADRRGEVAARPGEGISRPGHDRCLEAGCRHRDDDTT